METDVYRKLQKHLDQMPVPFPETKSGVEIELLKNLFTEEEATIALELSAFPEPVEKIFSRLKSKNYTLEEVRKKLDEMVVKGTILGEEIRNQDKKLYNKIPLAIGMYEFQVDRLDKKFAELFYAYKDEAFIDKLFKMKTHQIRTIPVNIKIDHQFVVGNYDDIRKIVQHSKGPFALMNCICRQAKDKLEEPCRLTDRRESCITIEGSARFFINRGVARELNREELLKFLTEAKKDGLVLQPENTQHPNFICCCCGCCCGVLTAAKKYNRPAEILHSNFFTQADTEKCDGCEDCIERCQMDAIRKVNGYVEVQNQRCIGCGVCIPVCKQKALHMVKKEKEKIPPKNKGDMYKKMLIERYGFIGTLGFVTKGKLGLKV